MGLRSGRESPLNENKTKLRVAADICKLIMVKEHVTKSKVVSPYMISGILPEFSDPTRQVVPSHCRTADLPVCYWEILYQIPAETKSA